MRCRADQLWWWAGSIAFIAHGIAIVAYASDLLFSDGWTILRPDCLDDTIHWPWIFEWHNEHRLVWTKLLHWLNLRLLGYSLQAQAGVNFLIYAAASLAILRWVERQWRVPMGFLWLILANGSLWEIHHWGFQSHYNIYLLCFALALPALVRSGPSSWLGVLWANLGIWATAAGVFCAMACAALCMALAAVRPHARRRHALQAAAIVVGIVPWSWDFHVNPEHPSMSWPWQGLFWWHTGLTWAKTFGWYLQRTSAAWGGPYLMAFVGLWAWRCLRWRRVPRPMWPAWLALGAYSAALLMGQAATTMARARLGEPSDRYLAPVLFLLPAAWVLAWDAVRARPRTRGALAALVLVPLLPQYNFARIYRLAATGIDAHRACIAAYYRGAGSGICRPSYSPDGLPIILDRARALRLPFTQDMLPAVVCRHEAPAAPIDGVLCHADVIRVRTQARSLSQDDPTLGRYLEFDGWAWQRGVTVAARDVAVELRAADGRVCSFLAGRWPRPDVHPDRTRWSHTMDWGVHLVAPLPTDLLPGTYELAIRQGYGADAVTCPLRTPLHIPF